MKKLLNFRPILFIAISLCLGIATTYFYMRENMVWAIFLFSTFIICNVLYLSLLTNKQNLKEKLIFVFVFLLIFVIGSIGLFSQINNYKNSYLGGRIYNVTAKIVQINNEDYKTTAILDNAHIQGEQVLDLDYKISVEIYGNNNLDIGDVVQFKANLCDNTYIYDGKFNVYDVENGVKYFASINSENIKVVDNKINIFERAYIFIRNTLSQGLDENEFAVGLALLTGNSDFMNKNLQNSYRNAGVAHIFAVSGLHIGFLATALTFILKKFNINAILKCIFISVILFLYSGVCGFSASSLRASVMTTVSLFAMAIGKRYDGVTAMSLSAIIILLISPLQLLCVGFQLSFMVVLGIIMLANPIAKKLKFLPEKLARSIGAVVSAQLFSIPICLYAFGEFSTIAVMINLIFLPFLSTIFILLQVSVLMGGLLSIPHITLFVSNYIFKFINLCITFFDLQVFMVGGITFGGAVIFYYLTCIVASGFVNLKRKFQIITCFVLVFVALSSMLIIEDLESKNTDVYVTHNTSMSATFISKNKQNTLIISNVEYIFSVSKLSKISTVYGKVFDNVILMGGYNADIQVVLTKLHSIGKVKRLYYYGQRQEDMEQICKRSFPKTSLINYFDAQKLPIENLHLTSMMQGCALICDLCDKEIAILSTFEKVDFNLNDLVGNFYMMVCYDRADTILSRYSPTIAVSYKYSNAYQNSEQSGNMLFNFK